MRISNYRRPCDRLTALFARLLTAVTMAASVLFLASCAQSKTQTQTHQTAEADTLSRYVTLERSLHAEGFRADTARAQIALTDLTSEAFRGARLSVLGEGRQRARVEVRVRHDTLYVSAVCDSLARLVEWYQLRAEENQRQTQTTLTDETQTARSSPLTMWIFVGLLYASLGGVVYLLFRILK